MHAICRPISLFNMVCGIVYRSGMIRHFSRAKPYGSLAIPRAIRITPLIGGNMGIYNWGILKDLNYGLKEQLKYSQTILEILDQQAL